MCSNFKKKFYIPDSNTTLYIKFETRPMFQFPNSNTTLHFKFQGNHIPNFRRNQLLQTPRNVSFPNAK